MTATPPPQIYDAVKNWACNEYGLDPESIVRPFYPGGDYERFDYPADCVVLDNPPFSCLSSIVRFYLMLEVPFFLFAPALTMLTSQNCAHIAAGTQIVYENGASVNTGFITNLEDCVLRTAPELYKAIAEAQEALNTESRRSLPKYEYPPEIVTAAMCNRYAKYGVTFRVEASEAARVTTLDAQRPFKKSIFGSGYLLSEEKTMDHIRAQAAAAQAAAAQKWELSEAERALQATLTPA